MQKFNHIVQSPAGIHARPAMLLTQKARKYQSRITIEYNQKSANAKNLVSLFSLKAFQGAEITVVVDGEDEILATKELQDFCCNNL